MVALVAFVSTSASAAEWRLLAPRDVYIDAYKNQTVHDPYLAPVDQDLSYGATFNIDADILKYRNWGLYTLNQVHFDQSGETGRIVHGGWQYEMGFSLFPTKKDPARGKIELFKQHHSRHIFEDERPGVHFPVYDRFGVRLRIWP